MGQAENRARWEYAKKLNIKFLGRAPPRLWPDTHRRLFEDIQKLGDQKYSCFSETVSVDSIDKPWRRQTRQRAARLAQRSLISREHRKNEAGWRFSIEPEVLHRFTVEVTCARCRSRLWKSEIEAAVQPAQPFAQTLEARRKRRQPCRCVDQWGYNSGYEDGVNMLFSDRAQAAIKHTPPLPIEGRRRGQASEEPDRVYGLQDTGSLRRVLNSTSKHVSNVGNFQTLRETLEVTPFEDEGERLLFPFLIMEAKSSKQGDAAAAEMQTAFCIQRLLKLQHELQGPSEDDCGTFEPLVWFVSWFGERWNVAGCFVNRTRSPVEWTIINLWSGDVTGEDGSLQLLLIMDYIFDWARDVYRPSLLAQLSILSMEDVDGAGPEILSSIERGSTVLTYRSSDPVESLSSSEPQTVVSSGEFLNLIHAEGAVRDASVIESRFMGLYITEQDVEPFRLSFSCDKTYRETIASIPSILEDSWRLLPDTLNGIEEVWTGTSRPSAGSHNSDKSPYFFVRFTFRMFVASDWQPVRELVCLALSSRAASKVWGDKTATIFNRVPVYTRLEMRKLLNSLKGPSIIDSLTAAVSFQCLSNAPRKRTGAFPLYGLKHDNSTLVIDLVSCVFESHTIGRRFSSESYLRYSTVQTRQSPHTEEPKVWPHLEQLALHPNGTVLVDSIQKNREAPCRCLYIVDGSYESANVADLVSRTSCEGSYYSTLPLPPGHDPAQYLAYINRPLNHARHWRTERNGEDFEAWITALREHKSAESVLPGTSSFPIPLLSSDEASSEDEDDKDTQITLALRAGN